MKSEREDNHFTKEKNFSCSWGNVVNFGSLFWLF